MRNLHGTQSLLEVSSPSVHALMVPRMSASRGCDGHSIRGLLAPIARKLAGSRRHVGAGQHCGCGAWCSVDSRIMWEGVLENADLLRVVCQEFEPRDLGGLVLASSRISEIVRDPTCSILRQCDENRKKAQRASLRGTSTCAVAV